jgi:alpha-mannosidase
VRIINDGDISKTIETISADSLKKKTQITLYKKLPRIEIQNTIEQNFSQTISPTFSFNIDKPNVWHEEIGAVINAKVQSHGGNYADSFARYDWLSMQHFANIGDDKSGITISNADGNFMQVGNSTSNFLDEKTPQIKLLLGGQMDKSVGLGIYNQGGDSVFTQTIALQPHSNTFNKTQSMKFALEHQTPLVSAFINGGNELPANSYSFLQINNNDVLLWALKPAEDEVAKAGIVARLWNMGEQNTAVTISATNNLNTAVRCTHIETDIEKEAVLKNKINTTFGLQEIKTWKLMMK